MRRDTKIVMAAAAIVPAAILGAALLCTRAIAGSLGGKKVTDRVSGTTLTRAFAVLLIGVAFYTATSSLMTAAASTTARSQREGAR